MKKLLGILVLGLLWCNTAFAGILPDTSPPKQYEIAIQFIKDNNLEKAEIALKEFVDKNPNHELAGNAQYWYGETFRARQRHHEAAEAYLEGLTKYPKNIKAPMNTLKLGVMLIFIGEWNNGCGLISNVKSQYPKAKKSVLKKTKDEYKKYQCQNSAQGPQNKYEKGKKKVVEKPGTKSIPNIGNSKWKTTQTKNEWKKKPPTISFLKNGKCVSLDGAGEKIDLTCAWQQDDDELTFIYDNQTTYVVKLSKNTWEGKAKNPKSGREWFSYGEALVIDSWLSVKAPDETKSKKKKPVASSGSAFFIDDKGHLITNFHVVEKCYDQSKIIYKTNEYDAKLIAKDKFLDLALLKSEIQNDKFIMISSKPPKKLKRIIVAGYPFGRELSDDLKFNSGIITSLKGLGDDSTRIQIDAAVNPGSSGGPIVYEENGQLAAVAVAGLRKDVTEAVNFGIKASSLRNFLEANQLNLATIAMKFNFDNDDLSELLEESTVYTFCK